MNDAHSRVLVVMLPMLSICPSVKQGPATAGCEGRGRRNACPQPAFRHSADCSAEVSTCNIARRAVTAGVSPAMAASDPTSPGLRRWGLAEAHSSFTAGMVYHTMELGIPADVIATTSSEGHKTRARLYMTFCD